MDMSKIGKEIENHEKLLKEEKAKLENLISELEEYQERCDRTLDALHEALEVIAEVV